MKKNKFAQIAKVSQDPQAIETRRAQYFQEMIEYSSPLDEWASRTSEKVRSRVKLRMTQIQHGMHTVSPLTCLGPSKCPFFTACPIPERDFQGEVINEEPEDYPIGLQCVLEGQYMAQKVVDYVQHLQVDPSNPIEMSIVNELALLDLLKNRGMLVLSSGDRQGQGRDLMLIDQTIMGFSDNGTPLMSTNTKIHPVLELIDKLEKRREKWLDKLMETREAKANWAVKAGQANSESKMLNEIAAIKSFIDNFQPIDGEQKIIPLDDEENPDEDDED